MKKMHQIFLNLKINIQTLLALLVSLFFIIGITYGFFRIDYSAHKLKGTFKSLRLRNDLSFKNNNVTILCEYMNTCYDKVGKKCFHLSSLKHNFTSFSEILDALTLYNNNTSIITEKYAAYKRNKIKNKHTICNRFITLGPRKGRTGNQMFEIASLLGTAYKYDIIPLIPANYTITKYFHLPNLVNQDLKELSNVVKCIAPKSAVFYNFREEMKTGKNLSLHGYLQSWKYFSEAQSIIRTVFKFKQKYLDRARDFFSRVTLDGYKRVCIHVRRGVLTSSAKQKIGFAIGGLVFIEKARAFFKRKYSKVQFIVLSDDKAWCRMNIKDSNISTLNDPGEDLALMTLCDDVVFSSSTFGWWGAWLSGGTTIYFDKYPWPGSALADRMSKEDFYPSNWIGLS